MPKSDEDRVTYFARTNHRNKRVPFGIRKADRRYHMHIIGRTGTGKSSLMLTMIKQDIANREGLIVFDPHGDMIEKIRADFPIHREQDLVDFDLTNPRLEYRFNPFENVPPNRQSATVLGLLDAFRQQWSDLWGPRLEHVLRNANRSRGSSS